MTEAPRIVTSRWDTLDAHTIDGYRRSGAYEGYAGIKAALDRSPAQVLDEAAKFVDSAIAPLQCALELEPAVAAHAWNLAAAAQAAQRLGTCYRSLRRYLEQTDDSDGAASRRRTAELFCRSYSAKTDEAPLVSTAQASFGED